MSATDFTFGSNNYESNIRAVYARASDADVVSGREWYALAFKTSANLTPSNPRLAAGIIAAFSPQLTWKANVALAARCIRRNRFTGHYGANNRKARKIANGKEPLDVLGGDKVRSFYKLIVSAGLDCNAVCIDRHAIAICLGRNASDKERKRIKGKRYAAYADAYRNVAHNVGLLASELQAVTWITWRREKGITD